MIRSEAAVPKGVLPAYTPHECGQVVLRLPEVAAHRAEHHRHEEEHSRLWVGNHMPSRVHSLQEDAIRLKGATCVPALLSTATLICVVHASKLLWRKRIHEHGR